MNEVLYIESATSLKSRLDRVISIIDALEIRLLNTIDQSDIDEYWLDDGQMKIKTIYRSTESMIKAIGLLERLKQKLVNQLNGRQCVLRSAKGLR